MTIQLDERTAKLDPVLAQLLAHSEQQLWTTLALTLREKVFLSIVGDVCQQSLGLPFARHVELAHHHGVALETIRTVLRFVAFDAGYAAATTAFERLVEIERGLGHAPAVAPDRLGDPRTLPRTLPPAIRALIRSADEAFAQYVDLESSMLATLEGLSPRERGLIAMAVDVLYQTLDDSFRVHVTRAMRGGAPRETVRAAINFVSQFGMTKAWRAFRALNEHFAELDSPLAAWAATAAPDAALEANKATVLAFYEAAINQRDFAAAAKHLGDRYVQHNPNIADGIPGFRAFIATLQDRFPELRAEVKRVFAHDEFVIVHTHGIRSPGELGSAIVDIFKLEDGKIVEHWDVMQPVPAQAANVNGMF